MRRLPADIEKDLKRQKNIINYLLHDLKFPSELVRHRSPGKKRPLNPEYEEKLGAHHHIRLQEMQV